MGKLDDILDSLPDTAMGQSIRFKASPAKKQAIKDLMLELIGEDDEGAELLENPMKRANATIRNQYRKELRQKVKEL